VTDPDATPAGTRTCVACGAQNDADRASCVECGAALGRETSTERPLGADRQFFEQGEPGSLADQRDLLDEEGEDIRQYTGEPVETDEGWVIPQQQNVGPGNQAGGVEDDRR
jgi:hypothetical protein